MSSIRKRLLWLLELRLAPSSENTGASSLKRPPLSHCYHDTSLLFLPTRLLIAFTASHVNYTCSRIVCVCVCVTGPRGEEPKNITSADLRPLSGTRRAWPIHYLALFLSLTHSHTNTHTPGMSPYLLVRPRTERWEPPWQSWGSACCQTCAKAQGWRQSPADRSPVDEESAERREVGLRF